jgi:hypothetical protein
MGLKIGFSREDQKTCDGVRKWDVEEDFWPERDEVTGEWRELHIAKGHDLYCSPDIITRVIKRWKMRWARHVARMVGRDCIRGFIERILKKILGRQRNR